MFTELTGSGRLAIIPGQNRRGSGSVVEHLLAKEKVAGSNPVFRSKRSFREGGPEGPFVVSLGEFRADVAEWQTLRS